MLYFLDLLGTFAFAITGAYKAKGAGLNIFGVILLGIITAVGGGTMSDLIINRVPLFYLTDSNYLLVAILAGIIVYLIPTFFKKKYSLFRLIDSLGLAAFVIIGASVSFSFLFENRNPSFLSAVVSVFLGMITGFGGGVIRDSIMGDVPVSLKKGSNYISSCFWGSFSFYFLRFIDIRLALLTSIIITLVLREVISQFGFYNKLVRKSAGSR
jgi:uncharacterized membrane protein YeiH